MAEVTSLIADFLSNSFASKSVTELETTVKTVLSSKNIQNSLKKTPTSERIISIEEVSWHDEPNDCWLIIFDKVYDVTNFLDEHPGGSEILLEFAGREATGAFRGSGHSRQAIQLLNTYFVGILPLHQRIYRKPGGKHPNDMPE